jgi:putative heme-binding domain-containing protein
VQLAELVAEATGQRQVLSIVVPTGGGAPLNVHLSYAARDGLARPVGFQQLSVPWAPPELPAGAAETVPEVQPLVGDARRGREVFFGQAGRCSTCHAVRGEGARLGPDLGNLSHRDQASVLRDLREPSAAINPDYLSYAVALVDGRLLSGTVRAEGSRSLRIADSEAKETIVPLEEVDQITPQGTSTMPSGLLDSLSPRDIEDLLAFLLAPPAPEGASPDREFPARSPAEIKAALEALPASPKGDRPRSLDLVLVDGPQDHGPGEHDYPAWQASWLTLLQAAPGVTVQKARDWPAPQQWRDAEVMVFYFWNHDWSPARLAELDAFLARGGGLVLLHSALISDDAPETLATRFGLAAQPQRTKYRHGPTELHFAENPKSPLVAGFSKLALVDETYWPMIGDRSKVGVLATAVEEGQEWPMLWTFEVGRGRVYASIIGHYSATHDDPLFRILVLRGIAWAAREPLGRFQELAAPANEGSPGQ